MTATALPVMTMPTIVVVLNKRDVPRRFSPRPVRFRCSPLVNGVRFGYDGALNAEGD